MQGDESIFQKRDAPTVTSTGRSGSEENTGAMMRRCSARVGAAARAAAIQRPLAVQPRWPTAYNAGWSGRRSREQGGRQPRA